MLSQVTNFLKRNKKIMYYLGFFALIYFALGDSVFAKEPESTDWVKYFNGFIQIISTWIGILSNIVWVFLNPSWTNASGIGLAGHLKSLWIMVSNIVYFIFAILIVVIAFMNILWKWDKWELKQALPKFIIWVLIVPFSWFFVQVILSISSILTASVLLLPYDTLVKSNPSGMDKLMSQPICNTFVIINTWTGETASTNQWCGNLTTDNIVGPLWTAQNKKSPTTVWQLLTWNWVYGLLSVYTYGIFSTWDLSVLKEQELDSFASIFKLWINVIVVLLLTVVYFILLVSLWLALFVRGIWLWLYMIFSPAFGLLYFFWKEKDGFIEGKFSITEFISLALVPVYVSAALAFGLLFTFVAGMSFNEQNGSMVFKYKEITTPTVYDNTKLVAKWKWSRISFLDQYHVDLYWDYGTSGKKTFEAMGMMKSWIGTIIMQFFGLAVLWISVMAAMWASKITWAVVEPIAAFGKQVWGLVAKSPQYAPIFGGQSMSSMKTTAGSVGNYYSNQQAEKSASFLKGTKFGSNAEDKSKITQLINKSKTEWPDGKQEALLELIKMTKWDVNQLKTDKQINQGLKAILPNILWKDHEWLKDLESFEGIAKAISAVDLKAGYMDTYSGTIENSKDLGLFVKEVHENDTPIWTSKSNNQWIIDDTIKYWDVSSKVITTEDKEWNTILHNDTVYNLARAVAQWFKWTDLVNGLANVWIQWNEVKTELEKIRQYLSLDKDNNIQFISAWEVKSDESIDIDALLLGKVEKAKK